MKYRSIETKLVLCRWTFSAVISSVVCTLRMLRYSDDQRITNATNHTSPLSYLTFDTKEKSSNLTQIPSQCQSCRKVCHSVSTYTSWHTRGCTWNVVRPHSGACTVWSSNTDIGHRSVCVIDSAFVRLGMNETSREESVCSTRIRIRTHGKRARVYVCVCVCVGREVAAFKCHLKWMKSRNGGRVFNSEQSWERFGIVSNRMRRIFIMFHANKHPSEFHTQRI